MTELEQKHLDIAFDKLYYLKNRGMVSTNTLIDLSLKYFSLEEKAKKFEFRRTLRQEIKDYIKELEQCPKF